MGNLSELAKLATTVEPGDFIKNPDRSSEAGFAYEFEGFVSKYRVSVWTISKGTVERLYDPIVWYKNADWTQSLIDLIAGMSDDDPDLMDAQELLAEYGDPDILG